MALAAAPPVGAGLARDRYNDTVNVAPEGAIARMAGSYRVRK